MAAERAALASRVFPAIRQLCQRRGLTCAEIDLRWGITAEQAERGEIVPVCLSEIERCNLFIGILGSQYGTRLRDLPGINRSSVYRRCPWVRQYSDRSVTELEILHAVLGDMPCCSHAMFYIREQTPASAELQCQQSDSADAPEALPDRSSPSEIAAGEHRLLTQLKQRILDSDAFVRQGYQNSAQLASWLVEDLTHAVETLFPAEDALEKGSLADSTHWAYARSLSSTFVSRSSELQKLAQIVKKDNRPLLITGPPGVGKSALVAKWLTRQANSQSVAANAGTSGWGSRWTGGGTQPTRHWKVLPRFVRADKGTTRLVPLLRSLWEEVQRHLGEHPSPPEDSAELRAGFSTLLDKVGPSSPLLLVLDDLDHVDARDLQLGVAWLTSIRSPNVRLLVTARPGPIVDECRDQRWQTLTIDELDVPDVANHISAYLGDVYGKQLELDARNQLEQMPPLRNPRFARSVFEELRHLGDMPAVSRFVAKLVEQPDLESLAKMILRRWKADYDVTDDGGPAELVPRLLKLLYTSRFGLTETEMRCLLGTRQQPVPSLYLSPLLQALDGWLIDRNGVLAPVSPELRYAIKQTWLESESAERDQHCQLAEFFATEPQTVRKMDELPWHYAGAGNWEALRDLLTDMSFLTESWTTHEHDLLSWWARLEKHYRISRVELLRDLIERPPLDFTSLQILCCLVEPQASGSQLMKLSEHLLRAGELIGREALHDALIYRGKVLYCQSLFADANRVYERLGQLCRDHSDTDGLATTLAQQAVVMRECGDHAAALAAFNEAMRLMAETGNVAGQSSVLNSIVVLHCKKRNAGKAMRRSREHERLCRKAGHVTGLLDCLISRNEIQIIRKRYKSVLRDIGKTRRLAEQLGLWTAVDSLLDQKIRALTQRERFAEVVDTLSERITLCDRFDLTDGRVSSRRQLAGLYRELGQLTASQRYLDEAQALEDRDARMAGL